MSKLTDYGTLVLARLATSRELTTTAALAETTGLPLPTVRKLLKALASAGLVTSERGVAGGYRLSRSAGTISAADILTALEGPLHLTECSAATHDCQLEATCTVGSAWQRINGHIRSALEAVTLEDLVRDAEPSVEFERRLQPITEITVRNQRHSA